MSTELAQQHEIIPLNAIESMTRAEVDIQISTAKRYPRSIAQVKKDMLSFATLDQETAESCFYSLPRGGKNIQGPSVRLAEIAVACYGNLRAGVRVVEAISTGDQPHVVLQAVCHDLEKNTCITIEKRRRIVGKKSKGGQIDEDDINLACNAGSAIAFRDCVFKVVPGALIKPVYEQAKAVAIGDAKTLGDRRERCVAAFAKMGIKVDRILSLLGKKGVDEIDLADIETLLGLHTAIKDGHTSIDEAFPNEVKVSAPRIFKPAPEPKADIELKFNTVHTEEEELPMEPVAPAQEKKEPEYIRSLRDQMKSDDVTLADVSTYAARMKYVKKGINRLDELSERAVVEMMAEGWEDVKEIAGNR